MDLPATTNFLRVGNLVHQLEILYYRTKQISKGLEKYLPNGPSNICEGSKEPDKMMYPVGYEPIY